MTTSYHILVVEDDPEIANLTLVTLERIGLVAMHANNGRVALDMVDDQKPDLMLLDLNLPEVSGWKVLEYAREQYGDGSFRVIVTTANNDPSNRLVGKLQVVDRYLTKPFTPQELMATVRAVLEMEE
jgi:two-component system response regulator AdeR